MRDGKVTKRVAYIVGGLLDRRKNNWHGKEPVEEGLDQVDDADKYEHEHLHIDDNTLRA